MKVAVVITSTHKQVMFEPENDHERAALRLIAPSDDVRVQWYAGAFGDRDEPHANVFPRECLGGYLRQFSSPGTMMLLVTPKEATP